MIFWVRESIYELVAKQLPNSFRGPPDFFRKVACSLALPASGRRSPPTLPNLIGRRETAVNRSKFGCHPTGSACIVQAMFQDTISLAAMADALSLSPDYRVLRRLVPRLPYVPSTHLDTKTAVLLDTETTGLDARKDEIIELGMVKFDYLPDGRIAGVRNTFCAFNEPTAPISAEVTALTGITDEMVAGHRINDAAVNAFVDDAAIVIAHNSGFDRKFAERYWPVFERKPWAAARPRSNGGNTGLPGRSSDSS